jgi:regulator of sigma E protease
MLVISFAVLLNINLAFLNLLPIPVLDGGHILFAIIEKLRGKALPPNFFATIQVGFTILFISLMFYIVFYGFMRWDGDAQLENEEDVNAEYYIKDLSF